MTSKLKCPICGTPLEYDIGYDGDYSCAKCGRAKMFGSEELWQELIRTRKALDVATWFIKGISQTAINDCDNQYVVLGNFKKFAQDTLNQIKTALEQKDVK